MSPFMYTRSFSSLYRLKLTAQQKVKWAPTTGTNQGRLKWLCPIQTDLMNRTKIRTHLCFAQNSGSTVCFPHEIVREHESQTYWCHSISCNLRKMRKFPRVTPNSGASLRSIEQLGSSPLWANGFPPSINRVSKFQALSSRRKLSGDWPSSETQQHTSQWLAPTVSSPRGGKSLS